MGSSFRKLMDKLLPRAFLFLAALTVPVLIIISPGLFKIQGVGPCWPIIWLLPCSLEIGPFWSVIFGIGLGSILDSITLSDVSYIPSLVFLGFWWGNLGRKQQHLNLGFLAFLGSGIVGLSFWFQTIFLHSLYLHGLFHSWAAHTLLAEMILTGLIAPLLCAWILILFKKV